MTPALKRGLFGFKTESVRRLLADRDQMFERAVQDARAAETRVDEATARLETARNERDAAQAEREAALAELELTSNERDTARAELETTRNERDAANEARDSLLTELAIRRGERDSARAELAQRQELLEETTARATRLEADVEVVRTELREHQEAARAASAEAASRRIELSATHRQIGERDARVEALEAELEQLRSDRAAERPEPEVSVAASSVTTSDDLGRVLRETENTISRMVAEARRSAVLELSEIERRRDELRGEINHLVEWRDRIAPIARSVRDLLGEAQARTAEIDERLRSALTPMTATIGSLRSRLTELVEEVGTGDDGSKADEESPAETPETSPSTVIHLDQEASSGRPSPW